MSKVISTINDWEIYESSFAHRKGKFFAQNKKNNNEYLNKQGLIINLNDLNSFNGDITSNYDQFYFDDIYFLFKVVADYVIANNKKKCRIVIDMEYNPKQTDHPKDWNWESLLNNGSIASTRTNFTIVSVEDLN